MAFLTGWSYRKKITLTGQTGAGTNYQVKLLVGESSGASGENFDLNSHSADFPNAKDDGGDLRFTSDDEVTLLDFWVESVSGTTPNRLATIWVEVAGDLGSNKDIYCYYGNSSSPANGSNGGNTFLFFDDFAGSSIDTGRWNTSLAPATYSVSNSILSMTADDNVDKRFYSNSAFSYNTALRTYRKANNTGDVYQGFGYWETNSANYIGIQPAHFNGTNLYGYYASKSGANSSGAKNLGIVATDSTNYNIWEIRRLQADIKIMLRDNQIYSFTTSSQIPTGNLYNEITVYTSGTINYIDWTLIRKFQATEPSYNTAGSEEVGVTNTGNFFQLF